MDARPLFEKDTDIVIGLNYDPVDFIRKYMLRWLERMELEGILLPPNYFGPFVIKVNFNLNVFVGNFRFLLYHSDGNYCASEQHVGIQIPVGTKVRKLEEKEDTKPVEEKSEANRNPQKNDD